MEMALERYDDGRSKSYYCLAAAILSIDSLNKASSMAERGDNLRKALAGLAEAEGQEMKLSK